jgi:hypothetical protein
MCAYDAVRLIAAALTAHLSRGGELTFRHRDWGAGRRSGASKTELARLKVLEQGPELRRELLRTKLRGSLGPVQLDRKGDVRAVCFEMVNVVGRGLRTIAYWHSTLGLSALPPSPHLL